MDFEREKWTLLAHFKSNFCDEQSIYQDNILQPSLPSHHSQHFPSHINEICMLEIAIGNLVLKIDHLLLHIQVVRKDVGV